MMFTVDASVHINALNPAGGGASESQSLLEQIFRRPWLVFSPMLLLVGIAAGVARVFDDAGQGLTMAQAVRGLPGQIWVPLDESLAEESARLAAESRLRGADAVHAAVTKRYGASLSRLAIGKLYQNPCILSSFVV